MGITMPVVKHSYLLQSTDELTTTFREAFHIAKTGRPGPVLIDVPSDLASELMTFEYPDDVNLPSYKPTYRGNAKQIKQAVSSSANQSGRCSTWAAVCFLRRVRRAEGARRAMQIPVVTTLMGKGRVPASHELNLGPGMHGSKYANLAMTESDPYHRCGSALLRSRDGQAGRVRAACRRHPHRHRPGRDRQGARRAGAHRGRSEGRARRHRVDVGEGGRAPRHGLRGWSRSPPGARASRSIIRAWATTPTRSSPRWCSRSFRTCSILRTASS